MGWAHMEHAYSVHTTKLYIDKKILHYIYIYIYIYINIHYTSLQGRTFPPFTQGSFTGKQLH